MFERILVPLDGSLLAEQAIPHAERFARIFGSSIVLLRVLEVSSDNENQSPIDPLSWQIRKVEADLYLQAIASSIRNHLQTLDKNSGNHTVYEDQIECAICEGRTADNIIDFALDEKIDLLVISSHGSGGLSRWSMSSVIQKVIDLVYLPLLIVRSFIPQEEINDQIQYRHILLPVDSSRRAECALPAAILLMQGEKSLERKPILDPSKSDQLAPEPVIVDGDTSKTKLVLAAVIKPLEIPIPKPYPVDVEKLSNQLLKISQQAVHAYLNMMQLRLPLISDVRVIESSNVSSAIQKMANQEDVDLIIISAHGNTEQLSLPYGNVTRNIMELSTKPILVIQDLSRYQVHPTAAAAAAEKSRAYYKVQKDRPEFAYNQYSSTSERHNKKEPKERNP